jgi:hypothetical protein
MNIQSFGTTRVLVLELPLESPKEKWHLDVVPTKKNKIYYKEGNGASSQRLQIVWSMCLRLSLLSPVHHLYLTYTNHLFFLVVQVGIILNSCLWVHRSPILELQHAFLSSKCYKSGSVPNFLLLSLFSLRDPPLGLFRSLRACHPPCPTIVVGW